VKYEEFSEDADMKPPESYYTSLEAIICNPLMKKANLSKSNDKRKEG
jgi:hypothetical protein